MSRGILNPRKGDFYDLNLKIMKLNSICNFISLLILLLGLSCISFPQTKPQHKDSRNLDLISGINKIIDDPFFNKTLISIDIFDLTDSLSLYQHNNKLLLHPASNMKILTSIAGLINLGEYYTFRTDLFHTGVLEDDTLYGDLCIVGGLDPDFTTSDLDSLVGIVNSLGVKHITGGVNADVSKKDSLYRGEGWMWDDDPSPSAPYLSALNINDNSIEVYVEGCVVDSPAVVKLIPETEFVSVENNSITVAARKPDNFSITRDWVAGENKIIIDGEIRKVSSIDSAEHTEKINILYPEKYFLTLLKEKLSKAGIEVQKQININRLPQNAVYLGSVYRSIDTVLYEMNKESDNLNAEMIIYAIAYKDSGAPANAKDGLAAIYRLIDSLGFNSEDYRIADGSGVSHYNLVSAELLSEALKFIYYKGNNLFGIFYNSLPVAGVDGTLRRRMKGTAAEGNVRAKTGTVSGVSTLSGYVTAKNGHLIAFSILIQNFVECYSTARSFQDKICVLLADYE